MVAFANMIVVIVLFRVQTNPRYCDDIDWNVARGGGAKWEKPTGRNSRIRREGKNNFLYAVQVVTGKFISTTGIALLWLKKIHFIVTKNFGNNFQVESLQYILENCCPISKVLFTVVSILFFIISIRGFTGLNRSGLFLCTLRKEGAIN